MRRELGVHAAHPQDGRDAGEDERNGGDAADLRPADQVGDGLEELGRNDILDQEGTFIVESEAELRVEVQRYHEVADMTLVGTRENLKLRIRNGNEERNPIRRSQGFQGRDRLIERLRRDGTGAERLVPAAERLPRFRTEGGAKTLAFGGRVRGVLPSWRSWEPL
ncbi:MAG: hypothetical protein GXP48_09090 [Acidobacteria bacterium]|nr:hypothetical protein [Acidobacteriota bacterium]